MIKRRGKETMDYLQNKPTYAIGQPWVSYINVLIISNSKHATLSECWPTLSVHEVMLTLS